MANEFTITAKIQDINGNLIIKHLPDPFFVTQTTAGAVQGCISIPTSDTVITLTGIATSGWAFFCNTDATNYIELGPTSGGAIVPFARLYPGEKCVIRLTPAIVLRAIAHTGAVRLQYTIFEV